MFTAICTMIAIILAIKSLEEYRAVSMYIALGFIFNLIIFNFVLVEFRQQNYGLLYLMYAASTGFVLFLMRDKKPHFFIVLLLFISIVINVNFAISAHFSTKATAFYEVFMSMYNSYYYAMGIIMILELIYMSVINENISRYLRNKGIFSRDYLDRLFFISNKRNSDRGVA